MSEKWLGGKEVQEDEFMAYVMSKVSSFAWVRYSMFSEDCIYDYPPIFCWRYIKKTDEGVYQRINACVSNFSGHVNWTMFKGSGKDGESRRNYTIEPEFIREIDKKHGLRKRPEILESDYKEEVQKAMEDVVALAKHIEKEMGVVDSDPILPTHPEDDM
ncbi:MAG: hypothetical protein FWG53_00220 [Clostridiales bacterium]|nr:hypothetical protein [Clostridiales bacterium]